MLIPSSKRKKEKENLKNTRILNIKIKLPLYLSRKRFSQKRFPPPPFTNKNTPLNRVNSLLN